MVFPRLSVIVTSVLLNVAVIWTMPSASTTFLTRLGPGAAAGPVGPVGGVGAVGVSAMLLLREHLLLAGDGPPRALLGPRVGVGPLSADGESLPMPRPAIRPNVHETLDVHRDFRAERTFHLHLALDHLPQTGDLTVTEIPHSRVGAHRGLVENALRGR